MTCPAPAAPRIQDHRIDHPEGALFARSWTPADDEAQAPNASPFLLFHDSLGCVELWRDFPEALCRASGRRVVAYDRLGFGHSDPRPARPSLDFVAEEAERYLPALIEQLALARFIPFGHSVGGGMAIHAAAGFPDHCEALITEAAQLFAEEKTLTSIAEAKLQFALPGQLERLKRYHGDKAAWVLDAWTENWLHPEFAYWHLRDVLPQVRCPLLALHGAHDEYGSACHPEQIAQLAGGPARYEILADTYHVPHRECAERVLQRVHTFLSTALTKPACA